MRKGNALLFHPAMIPHAGKSVEGKVRSAGGITDRCWSYDGNILYVVSKYDM